MDPKSISGISIPQWMKGRQTDSFETAPFSPPSHDDPIFYIRYPQKKKTTSDIRSLIVDDTTAPTTTVAPARSIFEKSQSTVDFSKHTESCRQFIGDKIASPVQQNKGQTKSQGIDDGFDTAACGTSIIKVAQKLVSGRHGAAGGGLSHLDEVNVENIDKVKEDDYMFQSRSMMRRGSKSLPASPMGSPKSIRKINYNPYFTNTYSSAGGADNRGWFLTGLLGIQREPTVTSSISSQIDEEIDDIYDSNIDINNLNKKTNQTSILKAKPSELREMNFWSPTSM